MTCALCNGTGFEIVTRDDRGYARPCSCRAPALAQAGPEALQAALRIPPRYAHCTIEQFTPGTPAQSAALEKALSYCSGFPHHGPDEGLGLLFTGANGVGKTHLAVAILRELAERQGVRGQYWDFHELIREIKNSYDATTSTTELQVLEPVVTTPLLLLDDLGAWKITEWMNDTLFYLLNSRYLARRPSIITTNFQDVEPETARQDNSPRSKEYLVERIGVRLRSRLMEMCVVIPLDGLDQRSKRQYGNQVALGGVPRRR